MQVNESIMFDLLQQNKNTYSRLVRNVNINKYNVLIYNHKKINSGFVSSNKTR